MGILMDSASLTFPFIFFGIYTHLPFHLVEILASLPFLFMIFFSTTFSPGSGVAGLKELRYLFARFYWWCMIPGVQEDMDNCPTEQPANLVYMVLSALIGLVLFLIIMGFIGCLRKKNTAKRSKKHNALKDDEFRDLQVELYGDRVLELQSTNHSSGSVGSGSRRLKGTV